MRDGLVVLLVLGIVLAAAVAGGCLSVQRSDSVRGTIVDAATCKPLSGVDVTVAWKAETPRALHGFDEELVVERKAVSGPDGSFTVAGWGPWLIRGRVPATFPTATLVKQGLEDTTHKNYFSGLGPGTYCNNQFTENTRDWWHAQGTINVTWNGCILEMPVGSANPDVTHNKALQPTPSRCALGRG